MKKSEPNIQYSNITPSALPFIAPRLSTYLTISLICPECPPASSRPSAGPERGKGACLSLFACIRKKSSTP